MFYGGHAVPVFFLSVDQLLDLRAIAVNRNSWRRLTGSLGPVFVELLFEVEDVAFLLLAASCEFR